MAPAARRWTISTRGRARPRSAATISGSGHLVSALARHGFVALSINVNAADTNGWGEAQGEPDGSDPSGDPRPSRRWQTTAASTGSACRWRAGSTSAGSASSATRNAGRGRSRLRGPRDKPPSPSPPGERGSEPCSCSRPCSGPAACRRARRSGLCSRSATTTSSTSAGSPTSTAPAVKAVPVRPSLGVSPRCEPQLLQLGARRRGWRQPPGVQAALEAAHESRPERLAGAVRARILPCDARRRAGRACCESRCGRAGSPPGLRPASAHIDPRAP